ncbi:MAG: DUF1629 domain-containing protein [Bacteroidota bacterium]
MEDLYYITIQKEPTAAVLDALVNIPRPYRLSKDLSLAAEFPEDTYFPMLPNYGMELRDFVNNQSGALVISERVRTFLEIQEDLSNVEFLPVAVLDHKGRPVDEQFYVAHILEHQNCLDGEASGGEVWPFKPDVFASVERLVLKEGCLDPGVILFRLDRYPYPVLVRQSLAERIKAQGFTGIEFNELDGFRHIAIL